MKVLIAVVMLLATAGLIYYNHQASLASEQAAAEALSHKPFKPFVPGAPRERLTVSVPTRPESEVLAPEDSEATVVVAPQAARFSCDGRTHCSHMRSCEEAKFFLQNCPTTKMDGDNDGIPCERQWC